MKQTKQAHRYAKALLATVKENNQVEAAREDMALIATAIDESRELGLLLKSPVVKSDAKLRILDKIFAGKIGDLSKKFITLITNKGREANLGLIAETFIEMSKIDEGIYQAKVISAAPLTDESRKDILDIASKIQNGKFELEEKVDINLIGGFVLTVGDQRIDTSVRSQFRKLRQEFMKNPDIAEI